MAFMASLPAIGQDITDWSMVEPFYTELATRPLNAANVDAWLADWSYLARLLAETDTNLLIATTCNTADTEAEQRRLKYLENVVPAMNVAEQSLKQKLLASGLEPDSFGLQLQKMRTDATLFRDTNIPLMVQEETLTLEYDKLIGAQTVQWDGQETTMPRLRLALQDQDRARREQAWTLAMQRSLEDRQSLNTLWTNLFTLRLQMAANAGFTNYRDYRWQQKHRYYYTPDDCLRFHDAIEKVVIPITTRLYEERRQQLGVETLRPWDMAVDPLNRPALKPFETVDELESRTATMFHRVDPQLGQNFEVLRHEKRLDLDNRKNKAPGGYCIWSEAQVPFIFMNATGSHNGIMTLLHEGGHSFHNFETRHLPYYQQLRPGREFTEVASMAMELLASPYLTLDEGGFYSKPDTARAQIRNLEVILNFWPYMAVVDAFQHWAYTHGDAAADPANCDAKWLELEQRFQPGLDWRGHETARMIGWQLKLHIFQDPFYYIEYGLAQLGAVQIWRNALQDQATAVVNYRKALSYGGTLPLAKLYETAGAALAFDSDTLSGAVNLIEQTLETLKQDS